MNTPIRRNLRSTTAKGLVSAAALLSTLAVLPVPASAASGDTSHAETLYLGGSLLTADANDVVTINGAEANSDGITPETVFPRALDVTLLDIPISLPGIEIPLDATDVGALAEYAHAGTEGDSMATTGLVTDDGAIATSDNPDNPPGALSLSLAGVLDNLGLDLTTLADVSVDFGGVSATANQQAPNDAVGDYQIDDLKLRFTSPAIADVVGTANDAVADLDTLLAGLDTELTNALNGILGLLGTVGDAGIQVTLPDLSAATDILTGEITPSNPDCAAVSINLGTGEVTVDLDELTELNGLPAGTEILTDATLTTITNCLDDIVNEVISRVDAALDAALDDLSVTINVDILNILTVDGSIEVDAEGNIDPDLSISVLGLPGIEVDDVLAALVAPINGILGDAQDLITGLTDGLDLALTDLGPLFDAINDDVASLTVNNQSTDADGLFTETALRLTVLPGTDALTLDVANASVGANALGAPDALSLDPGSGPEAGGQTVTIDGFNFNEATDVTIDGASVDFTVVDDSTITFVTPPHESGTVPVVVTSDLGDSAPLDYTYLPDGATAISLTPDQGPDVGGTVVTITGTDFTEATGVTFDGSQGTDFTIDSDTQITVTTPPGQAGPADVIVQSPAGNSDPLAFTYLPADADITDIDPNEGPEAGGQTVTITGTGFQSGNGIDGVTFDGIPATNVTVNSDTDLTAVTPPHDNGIVDVIVNHADTGPSNPLAYTYLPDAATATSLTPDQGPEAGGTIVTITGDDFTEATGVTIDGQPVDFTIDSDTQITVTTPAHAPGPVDVIVQSPAGNSDPLAFTYLAAEKEIVIDDVDPPRGPTSGGNIVTITGECFNGATDVLFDGVSALEFTVIDDNTIEAVPPPHAAGTVDVTVIGSDDCGDGTLPDSYTYDPDLVIDSIDPPRGPNSGGNIVTITGECFNGATDVLFDGVSALEFTVIDDNTIEAVPPPHAAGTVDVTVIGSDDCGDGTLPDSYTYDPDAPNPRPFLIPVDPARYWDTRPEPTFDGESRNTGRMASGGSYEIQIAGRGDVPVGAKGVVANLVADKTAGPGFATLYACDVAAPVASHVNYLGEQTVANNVVVPLSTDGKVCATTSAGTDMVLDVNGYIHPKAPDSMITPTRYLDTRDAGNTGTFDGEGEGGGPIDGLIEVPIAGRGDVPDNAKAAIVNVTAVDTADLGYVTVYPCDGERPTASNINYYPGDYMPNGAIATLSDTGTICLYTSAPANLLVDVAGFVHDYIDTTAVSSPARLFDSRAGEPLVDGTSTATRLTAGQSVEIQVAGRADVPDDAISAIMNVASENPLPYGYVSLYPCDQEREQTSNLNWTTELVRANNAISALSADGTVCAFALVDTDIVVDVSGWLMEFTS